MSNKKPFTVSREKDAVNPCVGCGKTGSMVLIIPTEWADAHIDEWFICSKCLQWLKAKLQGF